MPEYRFGISFLSKDRFTEAYKEELMVDKLTGEVLIKTPAGDTISYNYNSRIKSHIVETRNIANNMSIYGDIISIEMDNVHAPFTMEFDKNYIVNEMIIPYYNCKKILFNVDIDAIDINLTGASYDRNNMLIELVLSLYFDDNTTSDSINISYSMDQLNHTVLNLIDNNQFKNPKNKNIAGIIISSFKINNTIISYNGEYTESDKSIRPIFNSLFAIIQV